MKSALFTYSLVAAAAVCGAAPPTTSLPELRIMLQGRSAQDMRNLVTTNGGVVTHDLPIINAVGARISRPGLDKALESPLVQRYLDDLSISAEPDELPEEVENTCDVGGALELEINRTGINWRLYNKSDEIAKLSRLELSWPASLGRLTELRLGQQVFKLPSNPAQQSANEIALDFDRENTPEFKSTATLKARFSAPLHITDEAAVLQRDFSLEAHFVGDCSTQLVPGYANNHQNTFYPQVVGASALHEQGITGRGITVAIIDSGLWEHEALVNDTNGDNRLLARYDAITDTLGEVVFDESGHGTHMASVLAMSAPVMHQQSPTRSFKGVAPDVNLVAVKAFNTQGQGDFLDIVRAIQFVVDNRQKYQIKVLNLSFAARPRWQYWLDPINQAVMRAWASGITVVAAAGNEGPEPMTIGSPGNLPYVITVGAVTDSWTPENRSDDYIPDFSSRGPTPGAHIKPDIVAPGGHMTGITRPGSKLTADYPEYFLNTGEFVMTGSSQASALVSGIVALLLELEPELSPDDIKCKLMSSAEPAINSDGLLAYSPFQQGSGYVSATRAITLGQRGCGNPGMNLQKDIDGIEHSLGPAIVDADGSTSLPGLENMLSAEEPEKGPSKSRKWGAKNHIERTGYKWIGEENIAGGLPFEWEGVYLHEKAIMEGLTKKSSAED
jgi:serine protease AprX